MANVSLILMISFFCTFKGRKCSTYPYHSTPGGPLSKCSHYILYQDGQESGKQLIKYNMEHLKAVSVEWLFACLNNAALIDLEDFVRSPVYAQANEQSGKKQRNDMNTNLTKSLRGRN